MAFVLLMPCRQPEIYPANGIDIKPYKQNKNPI